MNNDLAEMARGIAERALQNTPVPGAAVALMIGGRMAFTAGIGNRDLRREETLEDSARFFVYSVTKILITAVILQLAEEGKIRLDAPLHAFLPEIPLAGAVTIRRLLNHTGGIPDYGAMEAYNAALRADPLYPWSAEKFLEMTLSRGLLFAPGQGWQYSNVGYLLLRLLIERILGVSLREAIHRRIAVPLGLRQTSVAENLADNQLMTPGYSAFFRRDGSLEDIRPVYHPGWVSHGAVISTAAEIALAVDAVLAGPLLNSASRAAMLEPVLVNTDHPFFRRPAYGLGVMIDAASPYGVMVGHGGGGPGYSAGVLHLPSVNGQRFTAAALCNCDQGDAGLTIAFDILMAAAAEIRE